MIFHEQERAVAFGDDFGHVALARSDPGQGFQSFSQCTPLWYPFAIGRRLPAGTDFQQFRYTFVAEGLAQAREEIEGQIRMSVGKETLGFGRQFPEFRRPPDGPWLRLALYELLLVQGVQMLPHRHGRNVQAIGQSGRVLGTFVFEPLQDLSARLRLGRHGHALFIKKILYKFKRRD